MSPRWTLPKLFRRTDCGQEEEESRCTQEEGDQEEEEEEVASLCERIERRDRLLNPAGTAVVSGVRNTTRKGRSKTFRSALFFWAPATVLADLTAR
jgi:hypothetical protein